MNKKTFISALFALVFCLSLMAVVRSQSPADAQTASEAVAPTTAASETQAPVASGAPMSMSMPMPAGASGFSGTVVETMNSGGYTYVFVDDGKEKQWAAAPACAVKVGDKVRIPEGSPMAGFHSKTLNRDFEMIFFVPAIMAENASGAAAVTSTTTTPAPVTTTASSDGCSSCPTGSSCSTSQPGQPAPSTGSTSASPVTPASVPQIQPSFAHGAAISSPTEDVVITGIAKAEGGNTVAEIYAEKTTLKGKAVKVRGKVVKFNSGIMNKNWFHIRDGSGQAGTNDLTVTTTTTVKVGDVVLVGGLLSVDKDFGHGYTYAVIVENAQVVK